MATRPAACASPFKLLLGQMTANQPLVAPKRISGALNRAMDELGIEPKTFPKSSGAAGCTAAPDCEWNALPTELHARTAGNSATRACSYRYPFAQRFPFVRRTIVGERSTLAQRRNPTRQRGPSVVTYPASAIFDSAAVPTPGGRVIILKDYGTGGGTKVLSTSTSFRRWRPMHL